MPNWDNHYLSRYYYEIGDSARSFEYARDATIPGLHDSQSGYYIALAYELNQQPDERVIDAIDCMAVGLYSEQVRALFHIVDGNNVSAKQHTQRIVDVSNPLDLSTAGLLLMHLAGDKALAAQEARKLGRVWAAERLDPWNEWVRESLLPYFVDLDEDRLLRNATRSRYHRRWLTLAHSTIAATRFGEGDMAGAREHAEACVNQRVVYLTDHICWRALLARPEKWKDR